LFFISTESDWTGQWVVERRLLSRRCVSVSCEGALLEGIFDKGGSSLEVRQVLPAFYREFYLHCLLHLFDNFDDDLLLDTLRLLSCVDL
jgi:hypothetical protein